MLSGTGAAPSAALASVSPSSIPFGPQQVNTPSGAQTVTLTNTGTLPMSIGGITIGGANAAEFAQTNTCPTVSSTLAVGASCRVDITVTPAATGSRSATLSIAGNATNSPSTVTLSASGTLPPGTYLSDGFESGLGSWATVGIGQAATGTPALTGTSSAVLSQSQGGIGILRGFDTQGQLEIHTRFCLYGVPPSVSVLAQGRDTNGANLWELDWDPGINGLDIYLWNGAHVRTDRYVSNVFTGGPWYCFDVDLDQAAAGHAGVSVNGTSLASAGLDFSNRTPYGQLLFWDYSASGAVTVDDVSVTAS